MIRPALLLALLAGPALADGGACTDGSRWWSFGSMAGLGPCEAPEEGFFVLACRNGGVIVDVESPFAVAEGDPVEAVLEVDGTPFALRGEGTLFGRTGVIGLGRAPVPAQAVAALRAGAAARFVLPTETRDIHLSGSSRAIGAMTARCRSE